MSDVSEMDFLSDLVPTVPSLDPSSELQNVTFLQNAFIATFLASLGASTIRDILGQSVYPGFALIGRALTFLGSHWSRWFLVLVVLTYAIKNQLGHSKPAMKGF